jgi:hypothetical protein
MAIPGLFGFYHGRDNSEGQPATRASRRHRRCCRICRFLNFITMVIKSETLPKNVNERVFRAYWALTGSTRTSPIGRVDGSIAATSAGHSRNFHRSDLSRGGFPRCRAARALQISPNLGRPIQIWIDPWFRETANARRLRDIDGILSYPNLDSLIDQRCRDDAGAGEGGGVISRAAGVATGP